ncbi:beta-ketoacyl synthase [Amycolatopsis tucumanensis]|uniref:Trans-2-decenoyl-[acyl-carrier-protein] isomerase n=1 Tax=Amycolatopsis tucumanensis TaxID=401106 RepID=A0ABP7HJR0_9PSEU|nr:beta-ketoacyl synthase [Amycolatopsis tucumanensis]MCF6423807.1 beta-ketoacyl synthase [Amycolatopsis tucumanensis]
MTTLEFAGDPLPLLPTTPAPPPDPVPATSGTSLRDTLAQAHVSALRAQAALQKLMLRTVAAPRPTTPAAAAPAVAEEGAFKPLAHTPVTTLTPAQLAQLAAGDIAGVFGPAYDQGEANPDLRLAAGKTLVLTGVDGLTRTGLTATCDTTDLVEAAVQAAQVVALRLGLHLCLPDATFVQQHSGHAEGVAGGGLELTVLAAGLVPRPHVKVEAHFRGGGRVSDLVVAVHEKPGTPIGPERGGTVPAWLGRKGATGERAMLSEFHLAHLAHGDQGIAFGPEFAHYTGTKATRLPNGGLLLVDRVLHLHGRRGELDGATYETEYDSPADSWYYADTANDSMPNFVYMETSLQAALLIGYYLGPTLSTPDATMSLRNLGGTATVLREVDLRGKTIRQRSELVSTTILPGSSLQSFRYVLSCDGEPFYQGETLFGYFSDEALANQTGLDAGRSVPTWLAENPAPVRRLDIAARRADPSAPLVARNKLALLDHVDVVDGGGRHSLGYLHSVRRIDPDEWFFTRHFHLDPVIPGSLGVESVIHALQEWLLDSGLADDLRDPGFIVPVGAEFTWKYRGQFLPTDGETRLEAHIKDVRRAPGRVRVTADASLWKPGLRIYELTDLAVELRERGAQPW